MEQAFESLLNFETELDVNLLDQVVEAFFGQVRKEEVIFLSVSNPSFRPERHSVDFFLFQVFVFESFFIPAFFIERATASFSDGIQRAPSCMDSSRHDFREIFEVSFNLIDCFFIFSLQPKNSFSRAANIGVLHSVPVEESSCRAEGRDQTVHCQFDCEILVERGVCSERENLSLQTESEFGSGPLVLSA